MTATAQRKLGGPAHEPGELHRLLVESVRDYAIFALDPNGYILSWNAGAERFKGYTSDEVIGKHFSIFYPTERVAEGFPDYELREAARTGRFEDEGWRVRKDGSRFWASVVITALHDKAGDLVGFAKVTRDLTERRAAQERALEDTRRMAAEEAARHAAEVARERADRLQALTSALSAAHTIPEIAQIIVRDGFAAVGADAGALALTDEAREQVTLVGESGYTDIPEWARSVRTEENFPISVAVRTGTAVVYRSRAERDKRFPRLAGILAAFDVTVALPLSSRGRTVGVLAMHRNVGHELTDDALAFMEAFAQQCAQALERAQLYEAEQQARARADEANRAKSEFLAAMSHDLRTPLNAIGGYADLIAMGISGPVTDQQLQQLERIRLSQQHLLGLINDILNFSRIEAGKVSYNFAAVPLNEVIDSVKHMIAPQAASKGLHFEAKGCPADVVARADRARTEQIILNLLSNAVKFTDTGTVSLVCSLEGERTVELTVRDTGWGIAADHLQRIFEPFVQVGRSLTTTREGTGLGLAISRDLARAMNGDIRVESTPGAGSVFTLSLPRADAMPGD